LCTSGPSPSVHTTLLAFVALSYWAEGAGGSLFFNIELLILKTSCKVAAGNVGGGLVIGTRIVVVNDLTDGIVIDSENCISEILIALDSI